MIKKFLKNPKQLFLVLVFILAGVGLVTNPVFASMGTIMGSVVASLLGLIIQGLTKIMALLIGVFVGLAQYNDFIRAVPVRRGWIIVRDISNMFFVLALLVISFATILKIEAYDWKKYLPKLLLMAVVVNFSKTICGLFIDFSQVIMLTFVNGFKDIGEGSLIHMMGLKEIFTLQQRGDVDFYSLVGAYVLGLLYVVIGMVVLVAMVVALVMRMVLLWIYVILSPFAFLLAAFPGGKQYSSQWWSKFTKELIAGPVLAFFVWLSFASVTSTSSGSEVLNMKKEQFQKDATASSSTVATPGISEAAEPDNLVRFIVSIGMLVGGLMLAQQVGGSGGQMAGKGIKALQSGQKRIQDYGVRKAKNTAHVAGQYGSLARENLSAKTGMELSGKARKANRAAKLQGRLDTGAAKKQERFMDIAEKGGLRGNVALMSSGQGKAFQALRFGEAKRTAVRYKAKQELSDANEKLEATRGNDSVIEKAMASVDPKKKKQYEMSRVAYDTADKKVKEIDEAFKNKEIDSADVEKKNKERKAAVEKKKIAEKDMESIGSEIKTGPDGKGPSVSSLDLGRRKYERQKKDAEKKLKQTSGKSTFDVGSEKRKIDNKKQHEAAEKISHIDNINELSNALKDSVKSGDKELTKAIAKKMAKTGHADDITKTFGLSNDRNGMVKLSRMLQKDAKFSKQEALGTVSAVGDLAANNGQYATMGATVLENGVYREASQRESDIATHKAVSGKSYKELVQKGGVSSLGSYNGDKNGSGEHVVNNWTMDKASLAAVEVDPTKFIKALKENADVELITHMNSTANIEVLEANGQKGVIKAIKDLAKKLNGAKTSEEAIDAIKY